MSDGAAISGAIPERDVQSVYAAENAAARAEVYEWAEELYLDQLEAWRANMDSYQDRLRKWRAAGGVGLEPARPKRPPTLEQCREKSRQIRIKRERDATYYHDLTNPYA